MPSHLHAECEAIFFAWMSFDSKKDLSTGEIGLLIIYRSIIAQVKNLSKILARSC